MSLFSRFRRDDAEAAPPASFVPDGTVVYAVGDIHGRLDLLQQLEEFISNDASLVEATRRVIVYLGDYVDRGDQSHGVIEHLLKPPRQGFERVCLIGNHESYMLKFLTDSSVAPAWLANGGRDTLYSYGVSLPHAFGDSDATEKVRAEFQKCLPAAHEDFLRSLSLSHREGDYLFVHAGVRPGVALDEQDPEDLMWIRGEFLNADDDFGAVVVHGHSISDEPANLPNRIGVDTGAYATGCLTSVVLWRDERRFLRTSG